MSLNQLVTVGTAEEVIVRGVHRSRIAVAAIGIVVMLTAGVVSPPSAFAATTSPNLIRNAGGEPAVGSPVPGWRLVTGTTFESVAYGAPEFPTASDPGPAHRGANFLAGGSGEELEVAVQTASLGGYAQAIDAGAATFSLVGWLGGFDGQDDNATLSIRFVGATGSTTGTAAIGPVTSADRAGQTGLLRRTAGGAVPVGTRKVSVTLTLQRTSGSYNDGYADNLSLTIRTP